MKDSIFTTIYSRFTILLVTRLAGEAGLEYVEIQNLLEFYDDNRAQFSGTLLESGHGLVDPRGRLLPKYYDILGLYTTFIFQKPDPDVAPPLMTPLLHDGSHGTQIIDEMCGSSALPLPVMQQWEAITGHRLLERYDMTEFVMALSNPLNGLRKEGTVGKPFPGVQVKIIADDDSNEGVGELCVKSPSMFKEYWKVTKDSFIEGGYFKTGDDVKVDEDGYYVILGRTNADIMKVGGYKLSALEIEAILLEHPAVSECCVLGLPDKAYGEAVAAIVLPDIEIKKARDNELKPALTLDELCSMAKEKLAPYKLPTRLFIWEPLPRNAM